MGACSALERQQHVPRLFAEPVVIELETTAVITMEIARAAVTAALPSARRTSSRSCTSAAVRRVRRHRPRRQPKYLHECPPHVAVQCTITSMSSVMQDTNFGNDRVRRHHRPSAFMRRARDCARRCKHVVQTHRRPMQRCHCKRQWSPRTPSCLWTVWRQPARTQHTSA